MLAHCSSLPVVNPMLFYFPQCLETCYPEGNNRSRTRPYQDQQAVFVLQPILKLFIPVAQQAYYQYQQPVGGAKNFIPFLQVPCSVAFVYALFKRICAGRKSVYPECAVCFFIAASNRIPGSSSSISSVLQAK